jgi:hypothetical protein
MSSSISKRNVSKTAGALVPLVAVLLAGCAFGGGVQSATTVEADPEPPAAHLGDLEVRIREFNERVERTKPPWRFSDKNTAAEFLGGGFTNIVIDARGSTSTATATSPDLADDSVRNERYRLELVKRPDGSWKVDSATRTYKCQPNRGHQDFSAELCL